MYGYILCTDYLVHVHREDEDSEDEDKANVYDRHWRTDYQTVTWNDGISTLAKEIFPQITINRK